MQATEVIYRDSRRFVDCRPSILNLIEMIRLPKLIGLTNYESWAIRVKAALIAKVLFSFQTRSDKGPTAKEQNTNIKALSLI